ncbi:MAG TPA: site-specific DNA-methyltransferase [Nocardioidaceae bacterium]|nr:site-specific DNA-methyltransferase [Nocardioidaceae bacterium]
MSQKPENTVVLGDNMEVLPHLGDATVQLAYLDPPFNTGSTQTRRTLSVISEASTSPATPPSASPATPPRGDRTGFGGRRYRTTQTGRLDYPDAFDDYPGFLRPRLEQVHRLLHGSGTLYLHLDWREAHRCKLLLDEIFGPECFLNEIVWAYDYGGRARDRWPAKHDTVLVYVKTAGAHFFDQDAIERIPYMAPGLVTPEKAARGKLPTDVWWHTIVGTRSAEKTGYPTQKPEGVLRRIVAASSRPGDVVLDCFAGSGTTGAVAAALGRRFVLVDENPEAVRVIRTRLEATRAAARTAYLHPDGTPLDRTDAPATTPRDY